MTHTVRARRGSDHSPTGCCHIPGWVYAAPETDGRGGARAYTSALCLNSVTLQITLGVIEVLASPSGRGHRCSVRMPELQHPGSDLHSV